MISKREEELNVVEEQKNEENEQIDKKVSHRLFLDDVEYSAFTRRL